MSRELSLDSIPDDELLRRLSTLVERHRRLDAAVVAHIAEVDARRLYLGQACSSMYTYCVERLHLSEAEAYLRIAVARASRRFPVVLAMLADGRLHLSAIAKLAPHLREESAEALLERAVHKTKREVELLVAEIAPRTDVASRIRKLPVARPRPTRPAPASGDGGGLESAARGVDGSAAPEPDSGGAIETGHAIESPALPESVLLRPDAVRPPARPAVVQPIAPARYKVEFTASAELRDKLGRAQALLRHRLPGSSDVALGQGAASGSPSATATIDLAEVIDQAVTLFLGKLEARRFGKTETPRKALEDTDTAASSRHIPAAVKRAVYQRDGGRCAFVDARGRRCSCTDPGALEYHHLRPYAMGGDHSPALIELRCRAHNQHQAELDFGREKMQRHRTRTSRAREPMAANQQGDCNCPTTSLPRSRQPSTPPSPPRT